MQRALGCSRLPQHTSSIQLCVQLSLGAAGACRLLPGQTAAAAAVVVPARSPAAGPAPAPATQHAVRQHVPSAPANSASHAPQTSTTAVTAAPPDTVPAAFQEWAGLKAWRARGVDRGRWWGQAGPTPGVAVPREQEWAEVPLAGSLVECAVQVLRTACPYGKAALTHRAWVAYNQGLLPLRPATASASQTCSCSNSSNGSSRHTGFHSMDLQNSSVEQLPVASTQLPARPARPDKPQLVPPKQVPSFERGHSPMTCLAAHLLHNLAHIELNAIDLAWDTVARWGGLTSLPPTFYEDFARVADDESRHLGWCLQRLQELGHAYGDMPAHDLLWEGCAASAGDLTARLAIVPMSQEARGLDAGQRLVARLTGAGDKRTAAIVARIADEEHAHVAVGVAWFHRVCTALDLQAAPLFRQHLTALGPDLLKGPFHHQARQTVGLERTMYDVALWPADAAAAITPPAVAAARRGKGAALHAAVTAHQESSPDTAGAAAAAPAACKSASSSPTPPVVPPCPVADVAPHMHASMAEGDEQAQSEAQGVGRCQEPSSQAHAPLAGHWIAGDSSLQGRASAQPWDLQDLSALQDLKQRLELLLRQEGLAQSVAGRG